MKKILATLMLIGTSFAFTAQAQPWNHNGSTMSVNISNDQIKIYYAQPRKVMLDAGAKPNDLLFEGKITGNIIVGTAKIFAHHCGQFTYQVAGSINANKSEINLNGQAPVVDRSTCQQTRLVPDALAFNILPTNATTDTSTNPRRQSQTLPNQYVAKLDGNWYSSQWKYGYQLKDGIGVATSTNSPNFQVGQTIIQLTATSPTTFTGQQVYTDGKFYKVNVTLQTDGSLYFEGEKNAKWTMNRVQSGSVATVTESQSRSASPPEQPPNNACNEKISQLNSDLQSILRKTPAMPPLAQIYSPLRDLYEQAKAARDAGKYSECVKKADSALQHSRAYAR